MNMEKNYNDIFIGKLLEVVEKVIVGENKYTIIDELIEHQSIRLNEIIDWIVNHLSEIQDQNKLESLVQFIARSCFLNKSLESIKQWIKSIDDNEDNVSKKKFFKRVIQEIGKRKFYCI